MKTLPLALVVASFVVPSLALAQSVEVATTRPPPANQLGLQLGLGTPIGRYGIDYDRRLVGPLSASVGLGVGNGGPQAAAMLRLRRRSMSGNYALGVGAGASVGGIRSYALSPLDARTIELSNALWINGEGFLERYTASGFMVRITAGVGKATWSSSCWLEDPGFAGSADVSRACEGDEARVVVPSLALYFGKAF